MAYKEGITFTGVNKLTAKFKKLQRDAPRAGRAAVNMAAYMILESAKSKTPVESGQLRNSGVIDTQNAKKAGMYKVLIGFSALSEGGFDYAEIQHENEDYKHDVGEDHYLSKAFEEFERRGTQWMADQIYNALFR